MNLLKLDLAPGWKEMSKSFAHVFSRHQNQTAPYRGMTILPDWALQVDISESDSDYMISGDIPGVNTEDVKISFQDGMLIIQGDRKMAGLENGRGFHRTECSHGRFSRSFRMPDDADENTVKVAFKDGTIVLTLPKTTRGIVSR